MTHEERAAEAHARVVRSIVASIEGACDRVTVRWTPDYGSARQPVYSPTHRERDLAFAEAWWLRLTEAEREAYPEVAVMLNAAVRAMAGGE